MNEHTDATF